jgi:DNA-binding MltR family transcriptional regulator
MSQNDKYLFSFEAPKEGEEPKAFEKHLKPLFDELNKETDRGAALLSASVLDQTLADILLNFLVEGAATRVLLKYPQPLSSFSARQNMCLALGLISKAEYDECSLIRKVRNEFAHVADYSINFNHKRIGKLCESFMSTGTEKEAALRKREDSNRILFVLSVATLHWRWAKRSEAVKSIRCTILPDSATDIADQDGENKS